MRKVKLGISESEEDDLGVETQKRLPLLQDQETARTLNPLTGQTTKREGFDEDINSQLHRSDSDEDLRDFV